MDITRMFKPIALLSQSGILAVSGVGFVIWMGATGWQDRDGLIVGVLFVVLSVVQLLFSAFWWRQVKSQYVSSPSSAPLVDMAAEKPNGSAANGDGAAPLALAETDA